MINKNLFKELELYLKVPDLKNAEKLADEIWKRVRSLKFIRGNHDYIRGRETPFKYFYLGRNDNKIKIYNDDYNQNVKWNDLDVIDKIRLIETLPNFFERISSAFTNLNKKIDNFISKFKDINLSDEWK